MNLFGLQISRQKSATYSSVPQRGGWWSLVPFVREPFTGAWQRNITLSAEDVLTYHAVYACVTLIASDIGKLSLRLLEQNDDGVWEETTSPSFSPVLNKPNRYQTHIKFKEQWMVSKLTQGNTYVLKERDKRGVVSALYVLDPSRVRPMVAPDGEVFYALQEDDLNGVRSAVTVPASEIIHDVMVPLYHPLCGVSPLSACGLPATQGLRIQRNSTNFFGNGSQPGGLLTAPGPIGAEDAKTIREIWDSEYGGDNAGKVAVLGNGLKYEAMSVNAVDAQLIEQLKWTAEAVCSVYKVPAYMVGVGATPSYDNVNALNTQYYSQCLQNPMESIELLHDEGLELPTKYRTEFDRDDLILMDQASRVTAAGDSIRGGMKVNEARRKYYKLGPVEGGDAVYLQQQDFSIAALAKRDALADPFASLAPPRQAPAQLEPPAEARGVTLAQVRQAILHATERAFA